MGDGDDNRAVTDRPGWGFWALPAGLRPVAGGPGQTLDGVLAALAVQGSTPPFRAHVSAGSASFSIPAPFGRPWRRARVRIAGGRVHVAWREGLASRRFDEPLSAYAGIARWNGAAGRHWPLFTWSRRWTMVGLVHRTDPGLSVPLALSHDLGGLPRLQVAAAAALDLPVLVERPEGGAWSRLPASLAALPLVHRLADAARGAGRQRPPLPLPLTVAPPPGGARACYDAVVDRGLALLLLPPALSFIGGLWGVALGALVPAVAYGALWAYWHRPDRLTIDPDGLVSLRLARPFAVARRLAVPADSVIALRLDPALLEAPRLVVETTQGAWGLRIGGLPPAAAIGLRDDVLRALQATAPAGGV